MRSEGDHLVVSRVGGIARLCARGFVAVVICLWLAAYGLVGLVNAEDPPEPTTSVTTEVPTTTTTAAPTTTTAAPTTTTTIYTTTTTVVVTTTRRPATTTTTASTTTTEAPTSTTRETETTENRGTAIEPAVITPSVPETTVGGPDDSSGGGMSTGFKLTAIVIGLTVVGASIAALTVAYWRHTRPLPYLDALDVLGDSSPSGGGRVAGWTAEVGVIGNQNQIADSGTQQSIAPESIAPRTGLAGTASRVSKDLGAPRDEAGNDGDSVVKSSKAADINAMLFGDGSGSELRDSRVDEKAKSSDETISHVGSHGSRSESSEDSPSRFDDLFDDHESSIEIVTLEDLAGESGDKGLNKPDAADSVLDQNAMLDRGGDPDPNRGLDASGLWGAEDNTASPAGLSGAGSDGASFRWENTIGDPRADAPRPDTQAADSPAADAPDGENDR